MTENVKVWEEDILLPTYGIGKAEKNPMFLEKRVYQGSSGVVYPYPVVEKIEDTCEEKSYHAVYLENEYIKVMILPELGGRVQMAYDKIKNRQQSYIWNGSPYRKSGQVYSYNGKYPHLRNNPSYNKCPLQSDNGKHPVCHDRIQHSHRQETQIDRHHSQQQPDSPTREKSVGWVSDCTIFPEFPTLHVPDAR